MPKKDITNPKEFFKIEDSNDNDIFSEIIINQSVICDAMNEMFSSSASGPDGLPAILFKECRDELSTKSFPLDAQQNFMLMNFFFFFYLC